MSPLNLFNDIDKGTIDSLNKALEGGSELYAVPIQMAKVESLDRQFYKFMLNRFIPLADRLIDKNVKMTRKWKKKVRKVMKECFDYHEFTIITYDKYKIRLRQRERRHIIEKHNRVLLKDETGYYAAKQVEDGFFTVSSQEKGEWNNPTIIIKEK